MKVKKYVKLVKRICEKYIADGDRCPNCPLFPHCGFLLEDIDLDDLTSVMARYKKNKRILKDFEKGLI